MPSKRQKTLRLGKERYKRELDFVINEINEMDFYCIISSGGPLDEFSEYAQRILAQAKKVNSSVELQNKIYEIMKKFFGSDDAGAPHHYRKMAKRIFKEVRY